ncbi:MAG: RDD family protein [Gammaproteobacteria bacterium]|nr:RDD family protein [Gammaproteobacteria bacterium]
MLDTIRAFETPEGIELQLHVAGPVSRAAAWLVDSLIRACIYIAFTIIFSLLGKMGWGIILLVYFIVEWFYPVLFEVLKGTTPGKKLFNLWVCHDNGTPIGWQASMVRNLLRVADFLPFLYVLGLISMLINRDFKRLGDIAAGTLVVYRDEGERNYNLPEQKPLPSPQALRLVEQRAILEFAERGEKLSYERRIELSDILEELTTHKGDKGQEHLLRYASWIQRGGEQA